MRFFYSKIKLFPTTTEAKRATSTKQVSETNEDRKRRYKSVEDNQQDTFLFRKLLVKRVTEHRIAEENNSEVMLMVKIK